jgi:hypothetical protein
MDANDEEPPDHDFLELVIREVRLEFISRLAIEEQSCDMKS